MIIHTYTYLASILALAHTVHDHFINHTQHATPTCR